jgi:ATP-dependent helicase/nuclease subunit B
VAVLLRKNYRAPRTDIDAEIRRRLRSGESATFCYVVPTRRKIRELQRALLAEVPGNVAPSFGLYTFETLASALHSILNPPKRLVRSAVQAVLLLEAIRSVEGELSYIRLRGRSRTLPRGTFQKILRVIGYLKERGVYLPVLYDEVEHADVGERPKLADILKIYEAYDRLLGVRFTDVPGIMKEVNDGWVAASGAERFRAHFPECNAMFVAGFDEFSDPELTMLHHCSEMKEIGTLVAFDYHHENDEVFGHLRENYEKLLGMGFQQESMPAPGRSDTQAFFAQRLFRKAREADPATGRRGLPAANSITIAAAQDRAREAELVAKIIKRLVHERPGRDLSAICVSMVRPQEYTQLFRETLRRYEIPANITDRYNLHQSPLVVSIMSLLTLPERNYRLTNIMRALSSPYLRFGDRSAPLDAGNIYAVASLLKISGERTSWIRRIDERLAAVRERLRMADEEFEGPEFRRQESMLVKARSDLAVLFALLARFDEPMRPYEFKQRLCALLEEVHILESLLDGRGADLDALEVDTRAYQKFCGFIDEFLEILEVEGKGKERQPLSFYADRLRQAVSQERFNIRQKYGYGVNVTSFSETRGLRFEVMIMVGLIDGEFPLVYQPEIFFSTPRRERKERYHLQEQRYLFYQALTNYSERCYLTYPLTIGGKETVPSSFLDALREAAALEGDDKAFSELVARDIHSKEELHTYAGALLGKKADGAPADADWERCRTELGATFDRMRLAMDVERSRGSRTALPEYNGIIGAHVSPGAREALEQLRHRVYSVTQLESFGKCPFQYFADRVLRLNVIEEPEEGLTPIERGDLLHEILFEFYSARRKRGAPPLWNSSDDEFARANAEVQAIANAAITAMNVTDILRDVENETILGSDRREGILHEFLIRERGRETSTTPAFFEAAFGRKVESERRIDPHLRHPGAVTAGNVQLRGKIDRIDVGESFFSIIDYKSGRNPGREEIDLGISLQLPLYLYAVERILLEVQEKKLMPAAGMYYILKSPVKEKVGIASDEHNGEAFPRSRASRQLVPDDAELRRVIDRAVAFVNEYVDTIAKGSFPVEPKDPRRVCAYCDFQTTCRIQVRMPVDDRRGESEQSS